MSSGKHKIRGDWHITKCPQCGKTFYWLGAVEDWGPVWKDTALCSIPCMKAYDKAMLKKSAEHITKTKTYAAWKLKKAGHDFDAISAETGLRRDGISSTVTAFEDIYWKELEYLANA